MEKLAKAIAAAIGKNLGKSEEEVAVIAYGLIGLLQFFAILLLTSAVGLIFGFFLETLIVFLSVGFLRRLTGGAHSRGLYNCLVYSVLFVCGFSALAHFVLARPEFLKINILLCGFVFLFGYVMIALKAPVAPPNKPCRTEEKRRRLRRGAFTVLTAFLILVAVALYVGQTHWRFYSLALALALSVLWQIFMMTAPGHAFIRLIDGAFFRRENKQ